MDVDSFIAANDADWRRLDELSRGGPGRLAARRGSDISDAVALYLRVSTHLTQARSRYADPRLERYLNDLVARAGQAIYGARPGTVGGFLRFFGARYRAEVRRTAPFILVAAVVLAAVTLGSWAWVESSAEARLGLVPASARDTLDRIAEGRDPDLGPPPALSTEIFVNNVRVAFLAFALGITLGVGTLLVLVLNGELIGTLAGAFGAAGYAGPFWALILPHGVLELIAICIAAGAGLRIGWAIVEPGDRTRTAALAEETSAAVVVVLGVVPAFLLAAVIEGFVTGTSVPNGIELTLGLTVGIAYVLFLFGAPRRRAVRASRPT